MQGDFMLGVNVEKDEHLKIQLRYLGWIEGGILRRKAISGGFQ